MSDPRGSDPTQYWSPDQPTDKSTETPWWQKVRRHSPPAPPYSAQPQVQPYQQAPVPPAPPPYGRHAHYPQHVQQPVQSAPSTPAPASTADQPKKSKHWPLVIAVLLGALLAVVVAAVVVLTVRSSNSKELDVAKAESGVRQILTDPTQGYDVENITDVKCNGGDNPAVKKGDTFTCQVKVNGAKRQVTVLFVDDNGTYEVDRPR